MSDQPTPKPHPRLPNRGTVRVNYMYAPSPVIDASAVHAAPRTPPSDSSLTPEAKWREMFPHGVQSGPGVAAHPPASLPDYAQAAIDAGPQHVTRPFHHPAPVTGPQGNAATDAANLAQNLRLYAPSPTPTVPGKAAPAAQAAPRPGKDDYLQSAAVQSTLNQAAGRGHIVQDAPGYKHLVSTYGTGWQSPVPNTDSTAATATTAPNTTSAAAPEWQRAIMAKHPQIGIAGTKENIAFVNAYNDGVKTGTQSPDTAMALADAQHAKRVFAQQQLDNKLGYLGRSMEGGPFAIDGSHPSDQGVPYTYGSQPPAAANTPPAPATPPVPNMASHNIAQNNSGPQAAPSAPASPAPTPTDEH